MRVSEFDFDLPESLIALRPASPRDSARMLVVREDGRFEHSEVRSLPDFLCNGDVLVLNDTKVIPARLYGHRIGRGVAEPKIEALLHKRTGPRSFLAFARPARKLRPGDRVHLGSSLEAEVQTRGEGGEISLHFAKEGDELDRVIAAEGETPLPPYIAGRRRADSRDVLDYQTIFAKTEGSVAAPTAGLHFTPELLARLADRGVSRESVTLHVGAGTFLPVSASDTSEHRMHPETASLDGETAARVNRTRATGGRIVTAGTTSLRTVESAADDNGHLRAFSGETALFITPGYRFKAVNALLTNFHLPRSTLFMLVSAFSGLDVMRRAYAEAIAKSYRFYSYGDACLLFRQQ